MTGPADCKIKKTRRVIRCVFMPKSTNPVKVTVCNAGQRVPVILRCLVGQPQAVVANPPSTGMTAPQTKPLALEAR
jgi:hypothetical protein